ncbi:shikimate kinase [Anaeroselena agilis]|uniref:Shikimate kinase n=1 Tax=Anaeroselena agilis TaxID=3063788 RepID=A0ABU3NYC6_9FIRM|nr:shikimate kinase [Selenomonadales bacterium 4137-cl]
MKNIVLIGFMGTGKSSTGRLLAGRLGRPFIDVDRKIERETGLTIGELFAQHGETYFRAREKAAVARVARYRKAVIATGGGVVLDPDNMRRLRAGGVIICLTATVQVILERTGRRSTRPLLARPDREEIVARLLAERAPLYGQADFTLDTSDLTPQLTVEKIIAFLRQEGHIHGRS